MDRGKQAIFTLAMLLSAWLWLPIAVSGVNLTSSLAELDELKGMGLLEPGERDSDGRLLAPPVLMPPQDFCHFSRQLLRVSRIEI